MGRAEKPFIALKQHLRKMDKILIALLLINGQSTLRYLNYNLYVMR